MNKLQVVVKNPETYFVKRLIEEVGRENLHFVNPWGDHPLVDHGSKVLVRTSGVYGDDKDLRLLEGVDETLVINPLKALRFCRSKKTQYENLNKLGGVILPWIDLQSSTQEEITHFLGRQESERFLIKPHRGQGGWGVRVLEVNELLSWFKEASDREFILQPFIEDQEELRCFFVGDFVLTLLRQNDQRPMANFRQEGKALQVKEEDRFESFLRELRSRTGMVYGAVDAFLVKGQLVILEVNAVPGIEQLEEVTGINVMREFIRRI